MTACGAVVGHPDTAAELMRHNEPVLVFPGGGREISKFKGEEYQLRWQGRSGFARVAIAHNYPIVPVGLVGGDDVYRSITARNGIWGKLSQSVAPKLSGRADMAMPLVRGVGPTLIPRPERMYLSFATPISTTKPARTPAETWEGLVKQRTQDSLESVLIDLIAVREHDPYRSLNPARRRRAAWPG
jgi:1-acyl-sn-glycerol-3-phosphate acyltransferase